MPIRSEAQRRFLWAAVDRGDISKEEVDKWESETTDKDLPEYVEKACIATLSDSDPIVGAEQLPMTHQGRSAQQAHEVAEHAAAAQYHHQRADQLHGTDPTSEMGSAHERAYQLHLAAAVDGRTEGDSAAARMASGRAIACEIDEKGVVAGV